MDVFPWVSMRHLCTEQGRGTRANDPLHLNLGLIRAPWLFQKAQAWTPGGSQHNFIRFPGEAALGAAIF